MAQHILVLGAGVSGLSTAILLPKKYYQVTIWAKDLPPYTTSNKTAAVCIPLFADHLIKCLHGPKLPWIPFAETSGRNFNRSKYWRPKSD